MKTLLLTLSFFSAVSLAVDPPIPALRVAFSDFGSGGSHQPQKAALELVNKAIAEKKVGLYQLEKVEHHGEITFCVEGFEGTLAKRDPDLSELKKALDKLAPAAGGTYSLKVTPVKNCD